VQDLVASSGAARLLLWFGVQWGELTGVLATTQGSFASEIAMK